ncbi:MAG TPA: glycosyltransferase family 4 protein [Steroidobacteraceae bacterium]|nr:glycosyltransferase family 4 protein [Steroidobacteraceae bacterium]
MNAPLRLLVWTSIPTHHQSSFFASLRSRDVDLIVHYLHHVNADRLSMGWAAHEELPRGERYTEASLQALDLCADWRERIHIVPGYNQVFLLQLVWHLSDRRVPWLHWGEHSWPRPRAYLTYAIKRFYWQMVRRHALGALAIGDLAREEFVRWGVPAQRICFLPYALPRVAVPADLEPMEMPIERPRFLYLGQLCPRKGVDVLLLAMRDVLAAHPGARLEVAGRDQPGSFYEHMAERLDISHAVRFSGVVDAARIGAVLQRSEVLILPSRHDGWGVVLNEAASLGKALIASDACGATHHLIEPGVNGFRFPAGNRSALTTAMLAYCRNPGLARRHGAESLRIFEDFTPERNAQRLEEALLSLLPAASATTPVKVA